MCLVHMSYGASLVPSRTRTLSQKLSSCDIYEVFVIVLPLRVTAISTYLVFPVDNQLRTDEGRWPDNYLTRTRYCSLGMRCISYTSTRPTLNLPTLRTWGVRLG